MGLRGWIGFGCGLAALGCGGMPLAPAAGEVAPAAPFTGAPAVAEVTILDGELTLRAWNLHPEPIDGFRLMLRFHDASDATLRVNVGTPFESEHLDTTMSGRVLPTGQWTTLSLGHVEVPSGAVRADALFSELLVGQGAVWAMDPTPYSRDPWPRQSAGPDLERWREPSAEAHFQGVHVVQPFYDARAMVWSVEGDRARLWDGAEETSGVLSFPFPCAVTLRKTRADGMIEIQSAAFTATADELLLDRHDHGFNDGTNAIVCHGSNAVTTFVDGTCTYWKRQSGSWFDDPSHCRFDEQDGQPVFDIQEQGRWAVRGTALVSTFVGDEARARPFSTFDEAKAAVPNP